MLVGAEAVVENGGVINKLGTYTLALAAREHNVPVYVAAESYKFARLYPLAQHDLPMERKTLDFGPLLPASVAVDNPSRDYTPPQVLVVVHVLLVRVLCAVPPVRVVCKPTLLTPLPQCKSTLTSSPYRTLHCSTSRCCSPTLGCSRPRPSVMSSSSSTSSPRLPPPLSRHTLLKHSALVYSCQMRVDVSS